MNDYKYLVSSPEVKRLERKDKIVNLSLSILGSIIGAACIVLSIHVALG